MYGSSRSFQHPLQYSLRCSVRLQRPNLVRPTTFWTPKELDRTHDAEIRSALARGNPRFHPTIPRDRFISGPNQGGSQGLTTLCTGMFFIASKSFNNNILCGISRKAVRKIDISPSVLACSRCAAYWLSKFSADVFKFCANMHPGELGFCSKHRFLR